MNYISAEEFLKQDDKVQNVLLDWWKPQIGDLLKFKYSSILLEIVIKEIDGFIYYRGGGMIPREIKDCIPLLQMHNLMDFIGEKINCRFNVGNLSKIIDTYRKELDIPYETDLLQALWKVVIQIAKEPV